MVGKVIQDYKISKPLGNFILTSRSRKIFNRL